MEMLLEVVQVPVADVDRARAFYEDQAGFAVDHDTQISDEVRVVQLTPPGSACSIVIGTGMAQMKPGSIEGLQLTEFFLVLSSTGLAYRHCRLAWVNGDQVGVSFLGRKKAKR